MTARHCISTTAWCHWLLFVLHVMALVTGSGHMAVFVCPKRMRRSFLIGLLAVRPFRCNDGMEIRKTLFAGSLFLVGAICGFALAVYRTSFPTESVEVAPGTEAISVLEEEVMSLIYTTEALTFGAQRSQPGGRFAVQITFSDGRSAQQCIASPDLAGSLTALSTIVARRQIQLQRVETEFPRKLGTLEIRDRMVGESSRPIEILTDANRNTLAARYEGAVIEIENPPSTFLQLEGGCQALGLQ